MEILKPVPNRFRGRQLVTYHTCYYSPVTNDPAVSFQFSFYWNSRRRIASMVCTYMVWGMRGSELKYVAKGFAGERIYRVGSNVFVTGADDFEQQCSIWYKRDGMDLMSSTREMGFWDDWDR